MRTIALLFAYIAVLCILPLDGSEAQDWNFHIVDDEGNAGAHSQIAVTSDGTPYILYEDTANSRILLAWWVPTGGNGGGWDKLDIGPSHYTYGCEMIADSDDHLHMAWENASSTRYGVYDPGTETWVIPEEEAAPAYGHLDLAIVEHNDTITAYIVYIIRYSPYDLRLCTRDPATGTWSTEVIHAPQCSQTLPSIAADSRGRLHISFRETASGSLMYATNANDSTTWVTEYVELGSNLGQYSSIVVDEYDVPYIIYYDAANDDLRYARMISD